MRNGIRLAAAFALWALCVLPVPQAAAHGEADEEMLAEFHEHLDDYRAEIDALRAELAPIVDGYAADKAVKPQVEALIEHWEEVQVHAAIERKATVTYPGVWQALIALQQAVEGGRPPADVRDAGERVEAALWQGFGALKLAASQVGSGTAVSAVANTDAAESGPETVDRIIADLEQAVAAYEADELGRAEGLIHETYMTRFEGLEGDLIERDPDLVTALERDFNATLPLLMQEGASMREVEVTLQSMKEQLETASTILESVERSRSEVF
jgi:hypothetical protein